MFDGGSLRLPLVCSSRAAERKRLQNRKEEPCSRGTQDVQERERYVQFGGLFRSVKDPYRFRQIRAVRCLSGARGAPGDPHVESGHGSQRATCRRSPRLFIAGACIRAVPLRHRANHPRTNADVHSAFRIASSGVKCATDNRQTRSERTPTENTNNRTGGTSRPKRDAGSGPNFGHTGQADRNNKGGEQ